MALRRYCQTARGKRTKGPLTSESQTKQDDLRNIESQSPSDSGLDTPHEPDFNAVNVFPGTQSSKAGEGSYAFHCGNFNAGPFRPSLCEYSVNDKGETIQKESKRSKRQER